MFVTQHTCTGTEHAADAWRSTAVDSMQACKLVPSSFGKVANGKEGRDPNFGNVGFNSLKPSGHYMYRQFNIQQFYGLPSQCICVFCVDLRTNRRLKENTDLLTLTPREKSDRN
jgi:hypothetical protein